MLLAIDTSAGTSVAVVDAVRGVIAERSTTDSMRHAEVIGQFTAEVLQEAAIRPAELSHIAVGMGPGPFTGLRVGIAAGRVFALGAGIPIVPIVSHDAIAFEHFAFEHFSAEQGRPLLVVTDARRRELYWSRYSGVDALGLPIRVEGPGLSKPDALPTQAGVQPGVQRVDGDRVSAAALGQLASLLIEHNRPFAADEPLYLRSPDVTLSTRKRVST